MDLEKKKESITVLVFGALRRYTQDQGLGASFEKHIGTKGLPAFELAAELSLPAEKIEAVFRNGHIVNIYDLVYPGDRVAFCPYGTPGPYRVFLGMARENEKRKRKEIRNTKKDPSR